MQTDRLLDLRWTAAGLLACAFMLGPTLAQGQDLDDLDDLDEGVVLEEVFEPGIKPNVWEFSMVFGTATLNQDLLKMDQVLVDVEEPGEFLFADTRLAGEASFSSQLRIGRTLGRHFALEGIGGFSVGDFEQEIDGDILNFRGSESDNELTELEREKGSYFNFTGELGGLWYPRGEGRIQPYLIGAVGGQIFELDTVYVDGPASGALFSYGAGLRIVGDDLYSFRLEVRNFHSTLAYDPGDIFAVVPSANNQELFDIPILQSTTITFAELRDEAVQEQLREVGLTPEKFISDIEKGFRTAQNDDNAQVPDDFQVSYFLPASGYEDVSLSTLFVSIGFVASF